MIAQNSRKSRMTQCSSSRKALLLGMAVPLLMVISQVCICAEPLGDTNDLTFAADAAAPKVIFVDINCPTCSNGNPGTESAPLCSIQAAANRAAPGTTIFVKEGTYNEMVTVRKSGQRGRMIKFLACDGDHVVIDSPSYACFDLAGVQYIKIHGFELTGAYGGAGTPVAHGAGIKAFPLTRTGYGAQNCMFANNVIHHNDAGLHLVASHRNFIQNNVVSYSDEAPIRIKRGDMNRIVNNLTFNNGVKEAWGITFYGGLGTKVIHNTIVEPAGGAVYIYEGTSNLDGAKPGSEGFCIPSAHSRVRDNICVVGGTADTDSVPLVIGSSTTTDRDPVIEELYGPIDNEYRYNLFFNANEPDAIVSWGDLSEKQTFPYYDLLSLSEFQAKHPHYGANCVAADPLFTDAANDDFTLSPSSPAKNSASDGKDIGVDFSSLPAAVQFTRQTWAAVNH
ncbi:MAG: right-handed parallel beta-helix repeat-containing protein [Acidobacteriota bacterium]